jgi:hypothetical protein
MERMFGLISSIAKEVFGSMTTMIRVGREGMENFLMDRSGLARILCLTSACTLSVFACGSPQAVDRISYESSPVIEDLLGPGSVVYWIMENECLAWDVIPQIGDANRGELVRTWRDEGGTWTGIYEYYYDHDPGRITLRGPSMSRDPPVVLEDGWRRIGSMRLCQETLEVRPGGPHVVMIGGTRWFGDLSTCREAVFAEEVSAPCSDGFKFRSALLGDRRHHLKDGPDAARELGAWSPGRVRAGDR